MIRMNIARMTICAAAQLAVHACWGAVAAAPVPAASGAATVESAPEVLVEGYHFPESATLYGQPLALNGAGVSYVLSYRATAVGFYMPKRQATVDGLLTERGNKRVMLYMLRDISTRDLSSSMLDRIRANASEEFSHNILQTAQLGEVFGTRAKVFKGDVVFIDYDDATQTTRFTLNGQRLGEEIKGTGFFPMMMKIWIGPKARAATRDALLGVAAK